LTGNGQRATGNGQRATGNGQRATGNGQRATKDVLDLGAGAGIIEYMNFKGLAGRVCGVDPDPRVIDNPYLDEGKVGFGEQIPYPDQSFYLVFCVNVLEHLERPEKVFSEIHRVLRPGGVFLSKTPNKWHYMPLIASLTPHQFHQWFNKKRGRESVDTFPTRYLANSPANVRRLAKATGFEVLAADLIEGRPEYMRISAPTYILGWFYEKAVNYIPGLGRFRILLVNALRKPEK
jgi:SAM-dependent methyltransferase